VGTAQPFAIEHVYNAPTRYREVVLTRPKPDFEFPAN